MPFTLSLILNKTQLVPGVPNLAFSDATIFFKLFSSYPEGKEKKKIPKRVFIVLPLMGRDWDNCPVPTWLGRDNKRGA